MNSALLPITESSNKVATTAWVQSLNYLTISGFNYNIQNYQLNNNINSTNINCTNLTASGTINGVKANIFSYLTTITGNVQNQLNNSISLSYLQLNYSTTSYLQSNYTTTANLNNYAFTGAPTLTNNVLPVSDFSLTLATNKWIHDCFTVYLPPYLTFLIVLLQIIY